MPEHEPGESHEILGHEIVGHGPVRAVVLNDWLCDTSTWDVARTYLDEERFTYAFVDLRGYGRSRHLAGTFTLLEAASDVLAVADALVVTPLTDCGHYPMQEMPPLTVALVERFLG